MTEWMEIKVLIAVMADHISGDTTEQCENVVNVP